MDTTSHFVQLPLAGNSTWIADLRKCCRRLDKDRNKLWQIGFASISTFLNSNESSNWASTGRFILVTLYCNTQLSQYPPALELPNAFLPLTSLMPLFEYETM
jgi:hypothetical protein